jgi:hypothetical protein
MLGPSSSNAMVYHVLAGDDAGRALFIRTAHSIFGVLRVTRVRVHFWMYVIYRAGVRLPLFASP